MAAIAAAGVGLMMVCCSSSSAFMMMGGDDSGGGGDDSGGGGDDSGGGGDSSNTTTFDPPVIPTDEASKGKCYLSRYTDMRLAYRKDGAKALTNSANRDVSCNITDEEAQCYLDRYPEAETYSGGDLDGARIHYYTVGKLLDYDFVCPPGAKEIGCYIENNSVMKAGLSTGGWGRDYNALQHWNNTGKDAGLSYTCT